MKFSSIVSSCNVLIIFGKIVESFLLIRVDSFKASVVFSLSENNNLPFKFLVSSKSIKDPCLSIIFFSNSIFLGCS